MSLGIAHEEIARGDFNAAYVLLIAALVGAIIARSGDARQQAAFLPPICRGEIITALAVTEPSGGSDAAHIKMQARRDGDNYVLSGEKTSISFSIVRRHRPRAGAHRHRRTGRARRQRILRRSQFTGRSRARAFATRLARNRPRQLFFDGVRVPAVARIGAEGAGFVAGDAGIRFQPLDDWPDVHRRGAAKRR